jgi:hypothetical protein
LLALMMLSSKVSRLLVGSRFATPLPPPSSASTEVKPTKFVWNPESSVDACCWNAGSDADADVAFEARLSARTIN